MDRDRSHTGTAELLAQRIGEPAHGELRRAVRTASARTVFADLPPSELPRSDRCSVRADLRPGRAELGGVKPKSDDRVRSFGLRFRHQPLSGVLTSRCKHLRHALELATEK